MSGQRLDKWLWCARLVKTRSGAARLIAAGKIRVNGMRALKASRLLQAGDVVTATCFGKLSVLRVIGAIDRRGPPAVARGLYQDLTPPLKSEEQAAAGGMSRGARPTKRDRRRLEAFRGDNA